MPAIIFDSRFLVAVALIYVGSLFAVAWVGDRSIARTGTIGGRPLIYALSVSVYCTSWSFFGSVGLAATTGYDFIPVYLGPILMFVILHPLLVRIVKLAKSQNLTSVSDFMAARYGKSQVVAAVVALVMVVGSLPYIALQLKAISTSVETLLGGDLLMPMVDSSVTYIDTSIVITLALAAFAILFGTRHIDATEHQDGLMLAIAVEGVVKLAALTAVGLFIVFWLFDGPLAFWHRAMETPNIGHVLSSPLQGGKWLTITLLSACCVILLPRQFHVIVVENNSDREMRRARWLFPSYLIAINLFVIPIAMAGLILQQPSLASRIADPDFFVLTVPMQAGSAVYSLLAFIGGLSSATAMVIVEAVALSIMASNGIILPLLLRARRGFNAAPNTTDLSHYVLGIRRLAIIVILLLAYGVFHGLAHAESLVSIGLISFAAIAQVAPAFFGGLLWRNATAAGAIAGIVTGFAVWAYTLLLPWIAKAGFLSLAFVNEGPYAIAALRPQALFFLQFDPLSHAAIWSLTLNTAAYIAVSKLWRPTPVERLQSQIFVPNDMERRPASKALRRLRTNLTISDLEAAAGRYLGADRARRSFAAFAAQYQPPLSEASRAEADIHAIRFTEHLLTSAVGAASARIIMSLMLRRENVSQRSALALLDDASEALQFSRDLLQSALDQVRHGLAVFDKDLSLVCWNRPFREFLRLPEDLVRVGMSLESVLRTSAQAAGIDHPNLDAIIADRVLALTLRHEIYHERELSGDVILEVRTNRMPQGGIVITLADITHQVRSDAALARSNETLERRVGERTRELLAVNTALAEAKADAEAANIDKTRFIAAASHDILQPLNAARLYAASLAERHAATRDAHLVANLDASLQAVEEIFSALIDMSRMDAGRMEPDVAPFALATLLEQLRVEFEPAAGAKGLQLTVVGSRVWVKTDRRLLRRVVQNLLANAIKFTSKGGVVVGVRRTSTGIAIAVYDTGPGIAAGDRALIFREFQRLDESSGSARGVGLGLSIVERICKVLNAKLELQSTVGRGSVFRVHIPIVPAVHVPLLQPRKAVPQIGSLQGMRILCIDNEPAVLEGMELLLKGWECTVETAASAEAIILRRMGFPLEADVWPNVILADYHLDQLTGIDAIERLRARAQRDIPAIIITADHTSEVQRQIRTRGIMQLQKPIKPAALRAVLTQVLTSARVHDRSVRPVERVLEAGQ